MKLSIEQVQELAELQKKVATANKKFDHVIVGYEDVHMREETFVETFSAYVVEDRDCDEYPYEVSSVAGGVKFFAIMSASELASLENTHPDAFDYISKAIQREGAK